MCLQDDLSEEEIRIYRHGRNAKTSSVAKHADIHDYRNATGLEALFGYLYLSGRLERAIDYAKSVSNGWIFYYRKKRILIMKEEYREENTTSSRIEGRHSVLEALRAGSLIERLFVQKGCQDGPVLTILREAKKADVMVDFVPKERLDFMSETKNHQGVVAVLSAFAYSTIDDMFALAEKKGETRSFLYWMVLKTRTIWVPSSVPQTLPVPTA